MTMTGRSTCNVNEGVDVHVAVKVKVSVNDEGNVDVFGNVPGL